MNPRPKKRHRSVYRFIGARWLSGSGVSAESVESVLREVSFLPSASGKKQAPNSVGTLPRSEATLGRFRDYAANA